MTRPVTLESLVGRSSAGFEEPFGMLEACHERIQRTLALLHRLRLHLRVHGADEQARQAAADVIRYFDRAAPEHHRDEELHVFPPLLASGDATVIALVNRLADEHREMETRWAVARRVLEAVAGGVRALKPEDEAALDSFEGLYAAHLCAEEEQAYPAAQTAIDAAARAAMSQDMMRRRGLG